MSGVGLGLHKERMNTYGAGIEKVSTLGRWEYRPSGAFASHLYQHAPLMCVAMLLQKYWDYGHVQIHGFVHSQKASNLQANISLNQFTSL